MHEIPAIFSYSHQGRRDEGSGVCISIDGPKSRGPVTDRGLSTQNANAVFHILSLSRIYQGTHVYALVRRIPNGYFCQAGIEGIFNLVYAVGRNENAPNRSTLLTRFARHLSYDFPHEKV
jgi:hypothetical protein